MPDYDVIVLGGGSAGPSAAAAAHDAGARTLMINDGELGGLCILRGCMPTKAMLSSAHALHVAETLEPLGGRLEGRAAADFQSIMRRKDALVARFQRSKIASVEASGYEVRSGRGRFAPGGAIEVDGDRLTAKSYVIATGSTPAAITIPGLDEIPVWSSDDVMRLTVQPRRLLVQGGGPVALELGQFFARLGTEVLLVNRSPLLSRVDPGLCDEFARALDAEKHLRRVVPGCIESVRPEGDGLVACVKSDGGVEEFRADALFMATGRRPALDDLGLEHVGLELHDGLLPHDETMRTDHSQIYVAGDATGDFQILHLGNQEGAVAGHNAAGAPTRKMSYRLRMSVVFTEPTFAQVGMTATEAREAGHDVVVGRARFPETGRAITMGVEHGEWRLVADRGSGEILGSTILGPRADDLIHIVMMMMSRRERVDRIFELPWYHPTLSEVVIDLARDVSRQRV